MKTIILSLFLFSNLLIFSQTNFKSDTYTTTLADIETNTFEKDTTANALVIYEKGNSFVDRNDFDLRTEIQCKIKILKKEGFNNANIVIHLYNNTHRAEKVEKIVGTTYNLINGKVVKSILSSKDIFKEKFDENHTLVKFTLPNIKEGSVITYSYTLISPFMFNYKGWNFQDDIPKLYSEYATSIPGNWDYNIKLIGGKKLTKNDCVLEKNCLTAGNGGSAGCSNCIYAMKDIPAFIEEDYMTTKSNYLARIEYELKTFQDFHGVKNDYAKTWSTVDDEIRKDDNIGRQLSKSIDTETLLSNDILSETDALKKAQNIYKFVQENYTWNEEYRIFHEVSVKDLIKEKSGNVSSINILLHNLLEDTGIDVKPVLLSTRNNGFATKIFPVISEFNYLIVQATINNKTYLLDATDKFLSFGDIPFRCLNRDARILDFKNGSNWIEITPDKLSTIQYKVELNLDDTNHLSGNALIKNTGYHALNAKKTYYPNSEIYINKLQDKFTNIEISNHNVLSEDKISPEFIESFDVDYENIAVGDNIYINPFLDKFFNENPFKLQERTYPIDFGYKDTYYYAFKLNFNETYSVLEKPKDVILSLPNDTGRITFTTNIIGNSVSMLFKFNFNEAIYEPEYYPYLKEFMNKIVDIQTNSLVLLKKK